MVFQSLVTIQNCIVCELLYHLVETYVAFTGPALDFEQHWVSVTGSDSIVFMVKVCSDAHLALAAIPGISQTMAYEV